MSAIKFFASLLTAVFFVCNVARAESSVYTVEVSVDVTDTNASVAREKAMLAANRRAFETVVRKITTSQGAQGLMNFSDDQILNFIKEVSVVSEKSSNVRYIADLLVTINESILKAYMQEKEIDSVVEASSRVIVVPVFREFEADKPLLWEQENIWRLAWENKLPKNSLVKISSIPANDVSISSIDAEKALSFDKSSLEEVLLNNNASDVYVVDAVYDGIDGLKVRLMSLKNANNAEDTVLVSGDRNHPAELMATAVDMVSAKIENKVKTASIAENQMLSTIDVIYNYSELRDWVATERLLKNIAYVRNLQVEAIGGGKVQFKLEFVGSDDKVWNALRANGLNLKQFDSIYLLER